METEKKTYEITVWQVLFLLFLSIISTFIAIVYIYPYNYFKVENGVVAINKYTREGIMYDAQDISYAYKIRIKEYEGRDAR